MLDLLVDSRKEPISETTTFFDKFGNKTEVSYRTIVRKISLAENGLLKQRGDMCKLESGRKGTRRQ